MDLPIVENARSKRICRRGDALYDRSGIVSLETLLLDSLPISSIPALRMVIANSSRETQLSMYLGGLYPVLGWEDVGGSAGPGWWRRGRCARGRRGARFLLIHEG